MGIDTGEPGPPFLPLYQPHKIMGKHIAAKPIMNKQITEKNVSQKSLIIKHHSHEEKQSR
jgi:hypothetical protein